MTPAALEILAGARMHDLSFAVRDHFRWGIERVTTDSLQAGAPFESSRFGMSAHAFTHADAPAHVAADGATLEQLDPSLWVGPAVVVDLTSVGANEPIDRALLDQRGSRVRPGDIVLLKTGWDTRTGIDRADYWQRAPYVTRDGAEWLAERGARSVGFDFPQDFAIRRTVGSDEKPAPADFVTHDVLLRKGVGLLEYLSGLSGITAERVFLVAAPIRLAGSDGGPVRALAFE
jgi:kynurenine formamidase